MKRRSQRRGRRQARQVRRRLLAGAAVLVSLSAGLSGALLLAPSPRDAGMETVSTGDARTDAPPRRLETDPLADVRETGRIGSGVPVPAGQASPFVNAGAAFDGGGGLQTGELALLAEGIPGYMEPIPRPGRITGPGGARSASAPARSGRFAAGGGAQSPYGNGSGGRSSPGPVAASGSPGGAAVRQGASQTAGPAPSTRYEPGGPGHHVGSPGPAGAGQGRDAQPATSTPGPGSEPGQGQQGPFLLSDGTLKGYGPLIDPLVVLAGGTLAPGASPGEMQLTDFTLDGGLLEIDIWGHGVGVGFDRLSVDGVARFVSGAIVFVFFDDVRGASFVPAPGDAFEFLTADGGIQGFDDNALLRLVSLGLDPAVEFLVRNTGTSLVLEIMAARQERQLETFGVPVFGVPLPPVLSLLLPALLLVRRRG